MMRSMQKVLTGSFFPALIAFPLTTGFGSGLKDLLFRRNQPVLKGNDPNADINILFLHHSTGRNIWKGGVKEWFKKYNYDHGTNYSMVEQDFPKRMPYGWNNYPFDYWNIWVDHAGDKPYKDEPTLEMITKKFDVVIWKHCFPCSNIEPDTGKPDITASRKTIGNYKLQYEALKEKMKEFPETKFIVWTGAALVKENTDEPTAMRAMEFFNWVREEWDEKGDNIFIWDFQSLETEGDLYLKDEYAKEPSNSHPNEDFSRRTAPLFCQRIVDVIEGRGDSGNIDGSK